MKISNSLIFFSVIFTFFITTSHHLRTMPSATESSDSDDESSTDTPAAAGTVAMPSASAKTTAPTTAPASEDDSEKPAVEATTGPLIEPTQFNTMDLEGTSGKQITSIPTNHKELEDLSTKAHELQTNMQTVLNNLEKTRTTCLETFHTVASPLDALLPEVSSLLGKYEKQVPSSNP